MHFVSRLVILFLMMWWLCNGVCAQDVQLDFRQFTTDDGLPSSEVYTVLEDQEGYIWVGTDNGVARFDGYSFEVFDSDDGLGDVVVFYLVMDDEGTVWAGTYPGRIYYFEDGRFVEFAHNEKIEMLRKGGEFVHLIDIMPSGELVLRLQRSGIYTISRVGEVRKISGDHPRQFYVYAKKRDNGGIEVAPISRGFLDNINLASDSIVEIEIMIHMDEKWKEFGYFSINPSEILTTGRGYRTVNIFSNNRLLLGEQEAFKIFTPGDKNREIKWAHLMWPNQLVQTSDSTALGLMDLNGGLINFTFKDDFSEMTIDTLVMGISCSDAFYDSRDGFWLASLNRGLFYCPYKEQRKFMKGANLKALSVEVIDETVFYSGYSNGAVFFNQIDSDNALTIRPLSQGSTFPNGLLFHEPVNGRVYGSSYRFSHSNGSNTVFDNGNYYQSKNEGLSLLKTITEFNSSDYLGADYLLVSNKTHFGIIHKKSESIEILNNEAHNLTYGVESFFVDTSGRYLLGTVNGLKRFVPDEKGGGIIDFNLGVKELDKRVVKILELQDGSLLFGTRGNGIIHLGQDTLILRQSNGLASDMVRHLHQSADGTIWVSTLNGLSKVQLEEDTFTVRTFRTENGLIDNEVHMVDTYGDAVYLATSSGVQRFVEPPLNKKSTSPVIRLFTADGDTLPVRDDYKLKSGYHSVNIHYSTINHRLGSNINYRYRLEEAEDWSYTQQRTVSFPRLGAGNFNFSVQSQNEDGFWSENTQLTINIPKLWYNTIYVWGGVTFLLGGIIFGVFYVREQRRKKEQDLVSQISKLEHEALHARMNPHFVFNCLNSIQNFVLENDTRSAATYLSRFSSLIRQILRSSVDGKHTLREEVQMLEKYLELEKLRFKTAFTHTVSVDASLDLDGISLAPLLVQPFVENAILHGMKGRKQGGRIKVTYEGDARLLKVTVTDNGKGIDRKLPKKKDSMGMDITLQRLTMMDQEGDIKSGMKIIPLFSEEGKAIGTRVELAIIPEIKENKTIEN